MAKHAAARMPWWAWFWPALSCAVLATAFALGLGAVMTALAAVALIATVFAAVWHAEIVAHRVGEPFGTLVLAVAVTVIEVALIVSVMLGGGAEKAALARPLLLPRTQSRCSKKMRRKKCCLSRSSKTAGSQTW